MKLIQEPMGTVECSLAEVLAAKGRFQRGLSPYIENPGNFFLNLSIELKQ